jgi:hypothetical protein
MEGIDQAFPMSARANRILLLTILAGLPIAAVLSWVYDFRAGRIQRTRAAEGTASTHGLMWLGLGVSVLVAVVVGWLLLRGE